MRNSSTLYSRWPVHFVILYSDSHSVKAPFSFTVTILPFFSGVVGFARSPRCFYIVRGFEFYDPHYQTSDKLNKPTPPVGERVGIYGKESAATSPLVTAP